MKRQKRFGELFRFREDIRIFSSKIRLRAVNKLSHKNIPSVAITFLKT